METNLDSKKHWAEDLNGCTGTPSEADFEEKTIGLFMEDGDYVGMLKELHGYLDMVRTIVKPGCSQEVLKIALKSMSSLVNNLTSMSSGPNLHASL